MPLNLVALDSDKTRRSIGWMCKIVEWNSSPSSDTHMSSGPEMRNVFSNGGEERIILILAAVFVAKSSSW